MPNINCAKVTISGDWTVSGWANEEWQTGWWISYPDGNDFSPQEIVDDVLADLKTAFTSPGMPAVARAQELKIARIGPSGHYLEAPGIGNMGGVIGGQAAPPNMIPQGTVVVTTIAESVWTGKGRYGRLYLPGYPTLTNGRLGSGGMTDRIGMVNAWFNVIKNNGHTSLVGTPLHPVENPLVDPGAAHLITQLRCGDVVDTQRRRRNNLVEAYTEDSYPI